MDDSLERCSRAGALPGTRPAFSSQPTCWRQGEKEPRSGRSGRFAPLVPVMEASETRHWHDLRGRRRRQCHGPTRWSVLSEAEMSAVLVEVADVGPSEPNSMALVENDSVIESLAAAPANPPLSYGILPGAAIGGSARFRRHRLDERNHVPAEDRVAVEDQMSRRGIERNASRSC